MRRLVAASVVALAFGSAALTPAPIPVVAPEFFAAHRERFMAKLPQDAVAVLRAAPESEAEVSDLYRQDSDFWYLTGLPDPNATAVLRPGARDGKRYILFVPPKDFSQEQWTGWRVGVEGARKEFGADEAYPIEEFWNKVPELLRPAASLYYADGHDAKFFEKLQSAWRAFDAQAPSTRPFVDAGPILHQMRLIKDETEQALLRHAAALSVEAHRAAMREAHPGRYEYALKSALVAVCLGSGAPRMAYPLIVGSGPNSVVLHYARDDRRMNAGEMIVNDSACEYGMYATDVTRSYPVSGKLSPEQRAIYDVVLAAQKAGFEKVRPGTVFHEIYDTTVSVIVDGLLRLGILPGGKEEIIGKGAYRKFYPHGCCHWLGLNVHDVGSYESARPDDRYSRYASAQVKLSPGMALTVEPGIYIPEGSTADPKWWNIGVRIEDDVLVTASGMECLTCALPREIADVEKALGKTK